MVTRRWTTMARQPRRVTPVVHRQGSAGEDRLREMVAVRLPRVVLVHLLGGQWI